MCGIFGYVGKNNQAAKLVLSGLKELEYRGYDSWGVAVVPLNDNPDKTNTIVVKKSAGKIGDADVNELPSGTLAFGHTRWATHGGVTKVNAHPHLDCSKTIAVIHNGIVENYEVLKKMLVKKGHKFVSETDIPVVALRCTGYFLSDERQGLPLTSACHPELTSRTASCCAIEMTATSCSGHWRYEST